jgi:hypothetical protein
MNWKQFRPIEKGEFIIVGVDPAAGGIDYCAAQFLSKTKLDVPLVYHSKVLATEMTNLLHPVLERIFDTTGIKPMVAYERQNGGLFEMERLAALNRLGKYNLFKMPVLGRIEPPEAVKYGWDTNTATRPKMLSDLKEAIDKKLIRIYDQTTINELFSFVIVQTSSSWKAQAEAGAHDDLIMALAIAWQVQQMVKEPRTMPQEYRTYTTYEKRSDLREKVRTFKGYHK